MPFFSVTGSSFVEMFVGVGAARVRDLFADARKRAPAIVFIDEIDAIGQRRGGVGVVVPTTSGSRPSTSCWPRWTVSTRPGVVVLAATNRPEVLDPALLRPGRFDRQVEIPLPNPGRAPRHPPVHSAARLDSDVDLDVVARGTPGFSGADLANLVNEAAIVAVRHDRDVITAADFDEARDRICSAGARAPTSLMPEEKHAVAVHEAGHALSPPLRTRPTRSPRSRSSPPGQALGVTEQLPLVERHLYGEDYL